MMVDAIEVLLAIFAIISLIWFLASVQDVSRSVEAVISGFAIVIFAVGFIYYRSEIKR